MPFPKREGPYFSPLLLVFLASLALGLPACRAHTPSGGKELTVEGEDGFVVHATLFAAASPHPPGLILLHMMGSSRNAWNAFAQQAVNNGYTVLAMDLRGHGDSTRFEGHSVNPSTFGAPEWIKVLGDIARAKKVLLDAAVDPDKIAVIGASIGANLTLRYAETDPQVQAIVMLSPGEEYRGIDISKTMESLRKRPVLIMATRGDTYSAQSSQKLDALAKEFCELRLYPGNAHGTDILGAEPVAAEQILMWLDQIFGTNATHK